MQRDKSDHLFFLWEISIYNRSDKMVFKLYYVFIIIIISQMYKCHRKIEFQECFIFHNNFDEN